MRVLTYSPAYLPSIGGLELAVASLSEGLAKIGFETAVLTTTPGPVAEEVVNGVTVVRRPGPRRMLRWFRWADVVHFANMSLRGFWPILLTRRPWVVSHHSWYCRTDGRVAWQDRLKRWLVRRADASVAVSRALAEDLGPETIVIPNAYRDDRFRRLPDVERTRELLFVGRLVSDKGVDLLLEALARLPAESGEVDLTIVGDGPELEHIRKKVQELELASRVRLLGRVVGDELVRLMNEHRVLVVPSRYREPFGIVALEGMACGCTVVGSSGGGLAEAVGPGGLTFPNGSVDALTFSLVSALFTWVPDVPAVERHLERHRQTVVVERHAAVLRAVRPLRASP